MPFNFSTLALPGTLFLGGASSWLHPLLLVPEPLFQDIGQDWSFLIEFFPDIVNINFMLKKKLDTIL